MRTIVALVRIPQHNRISVALAATRWWFVCGQWTGQTGKISRNSNEFLANVPFPKTKIPSHQGEE